MLLVCVLMSPCVKSISVHIVSFFAPSRWKVADAGASATGTAARVSPPARMVKTIAPATTPMIVTNPRRIAHPSFGLGFFAGSLTRRWYTAVPDASPASVKVPMDATGKDALEVARRCVCLELLFQRELLETDDEDALEDREQVRQAWLSRVGEDGLGVDAELLAEERDLLERPVGELSDDDLDDVHGRASGALVLLWALARLDTRPSFATIETIETVLASHGLLGDGSVSKARAAAEGARLRPEGELDEALGAYLRTRGKAREVDDPDRIFAGVAAHHLTWVLDRNMGFEADIEGR